MSTDHCLTCGGLILEPNKNYGYAGKVCYCQEAPRIRQRAGQQKQTCHERADDFGKTLMKAAIDNYQAATQHPLDTTKYPSLSEQVNSGAPGASACHDSLSEQFEKKHISPEDAALLRKVNAYNASTQPPLSDEQYVKEWRFMSSSGSDKAYITNKGVQRLIRIIDASQAREAKLMDAAKDTIARADDYADSYITRPIRDAVKALSDLERTGGGNGSKA